MTEVLLLAEVKQRLVKDHISQNPRFTQHDVGPAFIPLYNTVFVCVCVCVHVSVCVGMHLRV